MKIHLIDLHFRNKPQAIASYLVETSVGPVLVETGPHSTLPNLQTGVEKIGYQLEDIRYVLLTHIHLDHAGAAWYFAQRGARVFVHPVGLPHLAAPERLMLSAKRIYQDQMDSLWGEMHPIDEQQLVPMANAEILQVGDTAFTAWHSPGHATHHIAWQAGNALFTGDVGGVKIGKGIVMPPCPPPDIDLEAWDQSLNLISTLPVDTYYLAHFGAVSGDLAAHRKALRQRYRSWADVIKTYQDRGDTQEQMIEQFSAYVAQELRDVGLNQIEIEVYESANPSWMSVAGLLRYWNKRNKNK